MTTKEVQSMDDVKAAEIETISAKRRDFLHKAVTATVVASAAALLLSASATPALAQKRRRRCFAGAKEEELGWRLASRMLAEGVLH